MDLSFNGMVIRSILNREYEALKATINLPVGDLKLTVESVYYDEKN